MSYQLAFAFTCALAAASAAAQSSALTSDRALALALDNSPELIDAVAELGEARAQLAGADRLLQQNPQVQLGAGPQIRDSRSRPGDFGVQVMQPVELFGQRGARIDAAASAVDAAEARLGGARSELALRVRTAFARALAAKQESELAEAFLGLTSQALEAAESRLSAGAASKIELNAARVERGRAARRKVASAVALRGALGELRLLIGAQNVDSFEVAGNLSETVSSMGNVEDLVAKAVSERPEARAAKAELERARAEQRFAARSALPDVQLGAAYDGDEGIVKGMVGLTLPVFNQNQAGRGTAAARARRAEGNVAATERRIRAQVLLAAQRLESAREAAEALSTGVLAASKENLALVDEGYRAGKLDFLQLLIIRRDTVDARAEYIAALEELAVAEAGVLRALGRIE